MQMVIGLIGFSQSSLDGEIGELARLGCLLGLAHFVVDASLEAVVLVKHLVAALWRSLLGHVSSLIHLNVILGNT